LQLSASSPTVAFAEHFFLESIAKAYGLKLEYILLKKDGILVSALPLLRGTGIAYKSFSGFPHLGIPYCSAIGCADIFQTISRVLDWREQIVIYRLEFDQESEYGKPVMLTNMVDLSIGEEKIWRESFSKSTRKSINRADKAGIKVLDIGIEAISDFISFDREHHKRIGLAIDNRKHIMLKYLAERPESRDKLKLYAATYLNQVVEMSIMIYNDFFAHAWITAKRDVPALGNLSSKSALHWHAIKTARSLGCRFYDLCIINNDTLPGIANFKLGFSSKVYKVNQMSYKSKSFSVLNRLGRCL